jgi:aldehyde:ferredoxin oxidoreductase
MNYGWTGKILHIDLSSSETRIIRPERALYSKFIGGKGLAGHFLRPHISLPWDHPDMPLLIFTGPLVGTVAPTSGRSTVMSRSPLTGTIGDCSVGGRLGFQLKRAGWDGIIITGKADQPCSVEISDGEVQIHDAEQWSGKSTDEIFEVFSDGSRTVAAIGPAAESGVRFASLMVDKHHAAGRSGIGLCFAAKKLKFLTIHGTGKIPVADRQALLKAREEIMRLTAASPILMGEHGFSCFGTGSIYDLMDSRRMMPTDNFRKTHFGRAAQLNAYAYKESYLPEKHGCLGCHIRCKKVAHKGSMRGASMPEFETMSHFTALVGNTDMELVMEANALCNNFGMDTISAAASLACYRELNNNMDIGPQLLDLLTQIGTGSTDLGRELGQGSLHYATRKGTSPQSSMSVKGLELPAYDPRGAYGMSLAYALSTRGGCHLRAYPVSHEILRKPVATDRFTFSGKARIIKIAEDQNAVIDSLTACKFIFFAASLEEYAKAYSAVTGEKSSAQELLRIGERIYYQERIMNAENGFTADDDDLPERFFTEAGSSNGITINPLDRSAFLEARSKYYHIRGLDGKGRPTPEKSRELELT